MDLKQGYNFQKKFLSLHQVLLFIAKNIINLGNAITNVCRLNLNFTLLLFRAWDRPLGVNPGAELINDDNILETNFTDPSKIITKHRF